MGRKRKKLFRPWCWYCEREFEDETVLIQHQRAKHFKCQLCHRKLHTAAGMFIHMAQVHKETVDVVPNAIKGRDSGNLEIYGMQGVPVSDLLERYKDDASMINRIKSDLVPVSKPPGFVQDQYIPSHPLAQPTVDSSGYRKPVETIPAQRTPINFGLAIPRQVTTLKKASRPNENVPQPCLYYPYLDISVEERRILQGLSFP